MRLGKRRHKMASCVLGHSKELPAHLRDVVEVSQVFTPEDKRGEGRAKALLSLLCTEADENRTVLMLMPDNGLENLYAPHGFVRIQTNPVLMARKPLINAEKRCKPTCQTNPKT